MRDWWFRRRFEASPAAAAEEVVLELDGIATVAEVYVNGRRFSSSDSMFARSAVDVGALLTGDNELAICARALDPLLAISRAPAGPLAHARSSRAAAFASSGRCSWGVRPASRPDRRSSDPGARYALCGDAASR